MAKINKLLGLYELREIPIPQVKWEEFKPEASSFREDFLWSVRTASYGENDLNLPRLIGAGALKAWDFALSQYMVYKDRGLVFFYPYFIAEKSGTLLIKNEETVIEGVEADLWNLVTYNSRAVTIIEKDEKVSFYGDKDFLSPMELAEIRKFTAVIRNSLKGYLQEGQSILLEWSFGYDTNVKRERLSETHLLFYELKSI